MPSSALPQALCYEELLAAQQQLLPSFSWAPVSEHDPCGLCYTSGTTGNPKVSALMHGCWSMHASGCAVLHLHLQQYAQPDHSKQLA